MNAKQKLGNITLEQAKKLAPAFVEAKGLSLLEFSAEDAIEKCKRNTLAVVKCSENNGYKLVRISSVNKSTEPRIVKVTDGKTTWRIDLIAVL